MTSREQLVEQVAEPSLEHLDLGLGDRHLLRPIIRHGPGGRIVSPRPARTTSRRTSIVVKIVPVPHRQRSRPKIWICDGEPWRQSRTGQPPRESSSLRYAAPLYLYRRGERFRSQQAIAAWRPNSRVGASAVKAASRRSRVARSASLNRPAAGPAAAYRAVHGSVSAALWAQHPNNFVLRHSALHTRCA